MIAHQVRLALQIPFAVYVELHDRVVRQLFYRCSTIKDDHGIAVVVRRGKLSRREAGQLIGAAVVYCVVVSQIRRQVDQRLLSCHLV